MARLCQNYTLPCAIAPKKEKRLLLKARPCDVCLLIFANCYPQHCYSIPITTGHNQQFFSHPVAMFPSPTYFNKWCYTSSPGPNKPQKHYKQKQRN